MTLFLPAVGHCEKSFSICVSTIGHVSSQLIDTQVKNQRQVSNLATHSTWKCHVSKTWLGTGWMPLAFIKTDFSFLSPQNSIFSYFSIFLSIFLFSSCLNLSIWKFVCPSICPNASNK